MFCPKCGKEISDNATFCPFCGNSISSSKSIKNNDNKNKQFGNNKKNGKLLGIVVASIVVIIVIGTILVKTFGGNNGSAIADSNSFDYSVSENSISNESSRENIAETSDSEALNELCELIDEAEALVSKSYEDYSKVANDNPQLDFQERAKILKEAESGLENLQSQASQISGLDENVKTASNSYFDTVISSESKWYDVASFMAEYFKLTLVIPEFANYDSLTEYKEALDSWYKNNKPIIDSIEATACIETEWENYKNTFEIFKYIVEKEQYALDNNDYLVHYSAYSLANRNIKLEEHGYLALIEAFKGETEHAKYQRSIAHKLAEEIKAYSELDGNAQKGYEFEYDRSDKITVNYDVADIIYPALYNTYDAFAIVKTGCINGSRSIVVEAEIPGFTQLFKQSYNLDSSYKAIYIKPPALTGNIDLTSAKEAQINISVYEKDGSTLIDSKSLPVTIKGINDFAWIDSEYGLSTDFNLLCYLTPDSKSIAALKRNAIDEMTNLTGGAVESIVGYQTNYVGVYYQAASILRAMYDMGIRYNMDPYSHDDATQHILLPEQVVSLKSGLCIETSLLMASALQSANLNAYLVLPDGHAQVAVELEDGSGEYYLIETTSLDSDVNNDAVFSTYGNALASSSKLDDLDNISDPHDKKTYHWTWGIVYYSKSEWNEYIKENNVTIIDCNDSSILGLTPFVN